MANKKKVYNYKDIIKARQLFRVETYEILEWISNENRSKLFKDTYDIEVDDRLKLAAAKGLICCYCGCYMGYCILQSLAHETRNEFESRKFTVYFFDSYEQTKCFTKDHIIPKSKGGKNCLENYQPMCQICNSLKSDAHHNPEHFKKKHLDWSLKNKEKLEKERIVLSYPQLKGARPCLT